jgi:hypothetical protein
MFILLLTSSLWTVPSDAVYMSPLGVRIQEPMRVGMLSVGGVLRVGETDVLQALSDAQTMLKQQNETIQAYTATIQAQDMIIQDQAITLTQLQIVVTALSARLESTESATAALNTRLGFVETESAVNFSNFQLTIDNLRILEEVHTSQLADFSARLTAMESCDALPARVSELEADVVTLGALVGVMQINDSSLHSLQEDYALQIADLSLRLAAMEGINNTALATSLVSAHSEMLDSFGMQLASVQERVDTSEATLLFHTNLLGAITAVNSSNLAGTVAVMQLQQNAQADVFVRLQTQISNQTAMLSDLGVRVDLQDGQLSNLQTLAGAHTSQIVALQATNNSLVTRITAAEASTDVLGIMVYNQIGQINSLQTLTGAHTTKITALQIANVNLTARVSAAESLSSTLVTTLASHNRTLTQLSELTGTSLLITTVNAQSTTIGEQTALLFSQIATLQAVDLGHDASLFSLSSNESTLAIRVSVIESLSGTTSLVFKVSDLILRLAAVENLSGTATLLTTTIVTLQNSSNNLQQRLLNVETLSGSSALVSQLLSVRDFSVTSGGLYSAINWQNRTLSELIALTGASTLVSTVTGLRDYTVTSGGLFSAIQGQNLTLNQLSALTGPSTLVSTLVGIRDYSLTTCSLYSTISGLANTVTALGGLTGNSTLVATVTALRDTTGSSTLVSTVSGLSSSVSALNTMVGLSQSVISFLNSSTNVLLSLTSRVVALESPPEVHVIANVASGLGTNFTTSWQAYLDATGTSFLTGFSIQGGIVRLQGATVGSA